MNRLTLTAASAMGHLISRDDLRDVSQTVSIVAAGLDSRREMTSLGAQVRQELKQLRAGLSSTPVALPLQTAGPRAAGQGVGEWGRVRTGARPRHGPQFDRNGRLPEPETARQWNVLWSLDSIKGTEATGSPDRRAVRRSTLPSADPAKGAPHEVSRVLNRVLQAISV